MQPIYKQVSSFKMFTKTIFYFVFLFFVKNSTSTCDIKHISAYKITLNPYTKTIVQLDPKLLQDAVTISVYFTPIREMCSNFLEGSSVERVSFSQSKINRIQPGAFQNLSKLETVMIHDCDLKKIEAGVFSGTNIQTVDLLNNKIRIIEPEAFADMPYLNDVHLNMNRLTKVDGSWFNRSPKLSIVYLSENKIEELHEGDFKFQPFHKTPIKINLSNNEMHKIYSRTFENIREIHSLDLTNNKLKNLREGTFKNVDAVSRLYLDNNKFSCLNKELLRATPIKRLQIFDNNLSCECVAGLAEYEATTELLTGVRIGCESASKGEEKLF